MADILGKGRAEAITAEDVERLALDFGCHPADLEAISHVETRGFGWFPDGRMKILFEKHWFHKLLPASLRATATRKRIARKKWVSPKKGGYRDQNNADQRYEILEKAIELDETAALQSISMGRYQIMGFNWEICGFSSVEDMWGQFLDSEKNQLRAFANFLRRKGLVPAIRARKFRNVETVYNGGGLGGTYAREMEEHSNRLREGRWREWDPDEARKRLGGRVSLNLSNDLKRRPYLAEERDDMKNTQKSGFGFRGILGSLALLLGGGSVGSVATTPEAMTGLSSAASALVASTGPTSLTALMASLVLGLLSARFPFLGTLISDWRNGRRLRLEQQGVTPVSEPANQTG